MSDIIIEAFLVEPVEEAVNTGTLSKIFNVMKEKILSLLEKLIKKIKHIREKIHNFMNRKKSDFQGEKRTDSLREPIQDMVRELIPIYLKDIVHDYMSEEDFFYISFPKIADPKIMLENVNFIDLCKEAMNRILDEVKVINDIGNMASNSNIIEKFRKDICHIFKIDDKGYSDMDISDGMGTSSCSEYNDIKFASIINSNLFKSIIKYKIEKDNGVKIDVPDFEAEFDEFADSIEKVSRLLRNKVAPNENTTKRSTYDNVDIAKAIVNSNQNLSYSYKAYFNEVYRAIHFVTTAMLAPYNDILNFAIFNFAKAVTIYNERKINSSDK